MLSHVCFQRRASPSHGFVTRAPILLQYAYTPVLPLNKLELVEMPGSFFFGVVSSKSDVLDLPGGVSPMVTGHSSLDTTAWVKVHRQVCLGQLSAADAVLSRRMQVG